MLQAKNSYRPSCDRHTVADTCLGVSHGTFRDIRSTPSNIIFDLPVLPLTSRRRSVLSCDPSKSSTLTNCPMNTGINQYFVSGSSARRNMGRTGSNLCILPSTRVCDLISLVTSTRAAPSGMIKFNYWTKLSHGVGMVVGVGGLHEPGRPCPWHSLSPPRQNMCQFCRHNANMLVFSDIPTVPPEPARTTNAPPQSNVSAHPIS